MTHNFEREEWYKEAFFTAISGFLYGGTNTLVGHPLDTVKTKMQAQTEHMTSAGPFKTLWTVFSNEGIRGLYRGVIPPFFGSIFYRSLQFTVFEAFYTMWKDNQILTKEIPHSLGLQYRVVLAGLMSSTARAIVETPFEFAKVKGQTLQQWHVRDAYTGFTACWIRCCGLMTSYFMMIDTLRRHTNALNRKSTQFVASGGCATLAFLLVWPFETLKNQLQAQTKDIGNTWGEKFRFMINKYGYRGLYRGALPG